MVIDKLPVVNWRGERIEGGIAPCEAQIHMTGKKVGS